MSSPNFGFTPWRRRASSLTLQSHGREDVGPSPTGSPAHSVHPTTADGSRPLPTFATSVPREPIRSFIHSSLRDDLGPAHIVEDARSVREDTAELASYLLSDKRNIPQAPAFLTRRRSQTPLPLPPPQLRTPEIHDVTSVTGPELPHSAADTIQEVSEPSSPTEERHWDEDGDGEGVPDEGPSMLTNLLRKSPPQSRHGISPERPAEAGRSAVRKRSHSGERNGEQPSPDSVDEEASEHTPLLKKQPSAETQHTNGRDTLEDVESQKPETRRRWLGRIRNAGRRVQTRCVHAAKAATNPSIWTPTALWRNLVVTPASCLPAVMVGLLLNVLDALSYGMILFPLGKPIFAHLGSAGISIFYVSTIVSQLIFSSRSKFRGAVGSELIEVVPFFHNMAQTITDIIGQDEPDAVIATTITSYALSSMVTGTVFYLMGKYNFGYMVGFIPRHILIGCIGGVGWFLVATGFEVSARLSGSLEYDLETLRKLIQPDTVLLWAFPLLLAIILFYGQSRVASKYFLPLYIIAIPAIFYFFVAVIEPLNVDHLRDNGWIFDGPPADEPWWYFWTLYKFHLVRWDAVMDTVPAMLALTFFGILHVPINVPALALQTGEDHVDLDKELKLHGYSNFFSGLAGSIQNYLVYANTVFFMRSGGDSRLAGFMLAAMTFGVMTVGPTIIGFIPVMMVGTLIFDLGFELLLEAVWLPRKKLKVAEYLTVIAIVLIMGIYDFVIGIGVGILLAFISLIIQTSRVPAVRASYNGDIVGSTVRRNPSQHRYLQKARRQIYIVKLTGFLFFGTIVSVEEKIRALIEDDTFSERPIKFLVLDLYHVTGLDYSAGEAFNTISRLLDNKGVILVISGVDAESNLGRTLRAVGLGNGSVEVTLLPDLNSALESCENELLKTLYASEEEFHGGPRNAPSSSLDVPTKSPLSSPPELVLNSPRQSHLHAAAKDVLSSTETWRSTRWRSFKEPLRLMLQIFQSVSKQNEDFWFRATSYFVRKEYAAGTVLFRRGDPADGFYLVEEGILRAEYDLPQGWLAESIVAGTTCGELPFFSETDRTADVVVERDCVVWLIDKEGWSKLQKDEPEVTRELLRISLKLTSERMSSITAYTLTMAG
ncbi:sulfate transporter family protein [Sodiomyces alkalinus F11]|uniref:Sulfate transporter family protein n=1 Tax=Sodiomyces alkalinus (strain CBS 110278 / VKM F-3762 / F11) TaxID=1314773 RepID=A0A3N2PS73_SODAK|nr:sulfate transporter family protein [Sodiomyces alkalinus F11]ROT37369.1 sulfate transporter family protein [Sodiomyces alkalinus F11]